MYTRIVKISAVNSNLEFDIGSFMWIANGVRHGSSLKTRHT